MGLSQQESKQEVKNIFPHPFGNDGLSTSLSVHLIYVICSITFWLSPSSTLQCTFVFPGVEFTLKVS